MSTRPYPHKMNLEEDKFFYFMLRKVPNTDGMSLRGILIKLSTDDLGDNA